MRRKGIFSKDFQGNNITKKTTFLFNSVKKPSSKNFFTLGKLKEVQKKKKLAKENQVKLNLENSLNHSQQKASISNSTQFNSIPINTINKSKKRKRANPYNYNYSPQILNIQPPQFTKIDEISFPSPNSNNINNRKRKFSMAFGEKNDGYNDQVTTSSKKRASYFSQRSIVHNKNEVQKEKKVSYNDFVDDSNFNYGLKKNIFSIHSLANFIKGNPKKRTSIETKSLEKKQQHLNKSPNTNLELQKENEMDFSSPEANARSNRLKNPEETMKIKKKEAKEEKKEKEEKGKENKEKKKTELDDIEIGNTKEEYIIEDDAVFNIPDLDALLINSSFK